MPAMLPSAVLALAATEPAAQPISVETALLIIVGLGLLFAVKSLVQLHRRVDTLVAAIHPPAPHRDRRNEESSPSREVLVVISAAVFEALGSDHQVVSISAEEQNHTWSMEGRRQILGSHKVR
jgi:hypothetical protein